MRKIIIYFLLVSFGIFLGIFISNKKSISPLIDTKQSSVNKSKADQGIYINRESATVDFDGDGTREMVLAFTKDDYFSKDYDFDEYFVVYHGDKEIARSPKELPPIYSELPNNMKVYQFDKNSKKELLRLEAIAGTHHFNNLFLTVIGDKLLPVCKQEKPENLNDCIFYNTVVDL